MENISYSLSSMGCIAVTVKMCSVVYDILLWFIRVKGPSHDTD